jgi:hypothetical protein
MSAQSVLRAFTKHLRREDYASAVLFANNELWDGPFGQRLPHSRRA